MTLADIVAEALAAGRITSVDIAAGSPAEVDERYGQLVAATGINPERQGEWAPKWCGNAMRRWYRGIVWIHDRDKNTCLQVSVSTRSEAVDEVAA